MKLTLTIQEVVDKETNVRLKGVFGTLELTVPTTKGKTKIDRLNFVTTAKEIPGFDKIIEGLTISALELRKKNKEDKETVQGDINIPNRGTYRRKK